MALSKFNSGDFLVEVLEVLSHVASGISIDLGMEPDHQVLDVDSFKPLLLTTIATCDKGSYPLFKD